MTIKLFSIWILFELGHLFLFTSKRLLIDTLAIC